MWNVGVEPLWSPLDMNFSLSLSSHVYYIYILVCTCKNPTYSTFSLFSLVIYSLPWVINIHNLYSKVASPTSIALDILCSVLICDQCPSSWFLVIHYSMFIDILHFTSSKAYILSSTLKSHNLLQWFGK